jgi:hypothetical protein
MTQVGGDLDLAQEPLGAENRGELGAQDLDCDEALVLQIPSEKNGGHPAPTELALDSVPIGEGGLHTIGLLGHAL